MIFNLFTFEFQEGPYHRAGRKLRDARKAAGVSQAKLAADVGISMRTLSKYETGERDITIAQAATVYRLAKALGVTIEHLLDFE